MELSEEDKKRIIENNQKISLLLNENENILRTAGYDPPIKNYALEPSEKIGFPTKYIRTVEYFSTKYHLREICSNRITRQNIAYALEASDLLNYINNRVNIWGPVETVFLKLSIVNFVSILEALVLEAANNICKYASSCENTKKCELHFSKSERNNAREAVKKLNKIGILDFNESDLARIQEIIELRNRIHIRLAKGNELNQEIFTIELYNEVVFLLQKVDEKIYENAVPHYRCK